MNARLGLSAAALLFVSACSTPGGPFGGPFGGPPPPAAPFSASAFAWSTYPGAARIEGELDYAPGGRRHSCAATGVVLTPETPWVRQRMAILYGSNNAAALPAEEVRRRTPPESQDYSQFVRRASCDAAGNFTFTRLPPGAWYVITAARPADGGPDMAIMRRVTTGRDGTTRVRL